MTIDIETEKSMYLWVTLILVLTRNEWYERNYLNLLEKVFVIMKVRNQSYLVAVAIAAVVGVSWVMGNIGHFAFA
jgi:hypothetical protein